MLTQYAIELTIDTQVQKDLTKPDGKACNVDGTLKDASEIQFLHSPSDVAPGSLDVITLLNHGHTVGMKLTDVRIFSSTE